MRICIDEKNKRVIAYGTYRGRKVKAIAVCSPEDTFDENIGKQIATLKYKIKEQEVKKEIHISRLKHLNNICKWACKVIDDEQKIIHEMNAKISKLKSQSEEKINEILENK